MLNAIVQLQNSEGELLIEDYRKLGLTC